MVDLRAFAKGKPCFVRVPGWCNHEPETTVLAHVRMVGYSGMSMKIPDLFAAFACSHCHDIVDGRTPTLEFSYSERRALLLEGMVRTQIYLLERGILLVADALSEAQRLTTTENT